MGLPAVNTKDSVEVVRSLTTTDLVELAETPRSVVPHPIKKLRESHHLLARSIAMGWSLREIADKTGYSYSRISILKSDPTFAELIAHYRAKVDAIRDEVARDHFVQLAALHGDVIEELQDRVNDEPELISTDTLIDLAKFTSDRIGLGPTSKSQNVNVNVDLAGKVAAGRQRALQLSAASAVKPAPSVPLPLAGPAAPSEDENA